GVELQVVDAHTARAVGGARVELRGPGGTGVHQADADGRVRVVPLAIGRYRVRVDHPGYVQATSELEVPAAERPGTASVSGARVALERGATIAGTVRDGDGARVGGARVSVGSVVGHSDVSGRFRLGSVPTGRI